LKNPKFTIQKLVDNIKKAISRVLAVVAKILSQDLRELTIYSEELGKKLDKQTEEIAALRDDIKGQRANQQQLE
jgi:hypothetical protein